jgi:hypothetical protein
VAIVPQVSRRSGWLIAAVAVGLGGCTGVTGVPSTPPSVEVSQSRSTAPSASASGATGELEGCVPACIKGRTVPGDLPVGDYQTEWFFGGQMILTFQEEWTSPEDSTGEFFVAPLATPENAVVFWEDVYPTEGGEPVEGVPLSTAGLLGWFQTNPNFEVSEPASGTIGADLPATVVDITLSATAENQDPECPFSACLDFLGFPQWEGGWGIAGEQVQRFYMSDVTYGGQTHLFVVVVYPDDPNDMEDFLPVAEQVIASVRVPVTPGE